MNRDLEIRAYTSSDGTVCYGLRRSAFLGVFKEILEQPLAQAGADSYSLDEFIKQIGTMDTYVATVGGSVIGFCTIRVDTSKRAEILYLYVNTQQQRKGIGSILLRKAEQYILKSHPDIQELYLDTVVPDYNIGYWERMGYQYFGPSVCSYPTCKIQAIRLNKKVFSRNE